MKNLILALTLSIYSLSLYSSDRKSVIECRGTKCEKVTTITNIKERKLRIDEYKVNECYIDMSNSEVPKFFKLMQKKSNRDQLTFAMESSEKPKHLIRVRENFDSRSWNKKFPNGLKTFACTDTPNLSDEVRMNYCWSKYRSKMICVDPPLKRMSDRVSK